MNPAAGGACACPMPRGTVVDIAEYEADPDTFVEPHAGEVLYRLPSGYQDEVTGEPDGRLRAAEGLDG